MSKKEELDIPMTNAIRVLKDAKVAFEPMVYKYEDHGGTALAAAELGVPEHETVKTIILETDAKKPLVCLMHGDREISTKQLARLVGVKSIAPCEPEQASRNSGYFCGGTSPFGTRKRMPVYAEATLFDLPFIYINGGRRGMLVKIAPAVLDQILHTTHVSVAIEK